MRGFSSLFCDNDCLMKLNRVNRSMLLGGGAGLVST